VNCKVNYQLKVGASLAQVIELLSISSGGMSSNPALGGFVGLSVRSTDECELIAVNDLIHNN
jgi:hypothetical protein